MAEEKKDSFPWIQLIATVGTIMAALIGITPYILKLNTPAPQTPTIVFVTLPPAVTTEPTAVQTTPVTTQTTEVTTTIPTTGPPLTTTPGTNETANQTFATTVPTTSPVTTVATTLPPTVTTLPPGPAIQISVNATTVARGGTILASVSTDPGVPQVIITLRNSTTFESQPLTQTLTQGMVTISLDTAPYVPGDYTISAAVPNTQSVAQASFAITAA
ncbi:MAG: hypothetical protein LUQ49_03655 [Methanomicrobiales archaeon]|nr:hypothetical protein [Methanomicrobiales archaeon]